MRLSRRQLLARLPADGAPGSTAYAPPGADPAGITPQLTRLDGTARAAVVDALRASATGAALFADSERVMLVAPPFAIGSAASFGAINAGPLIELLERERLIGVLLLRLGGFTVGLLRGERVLDPKTDQRFVKNRHKKGGQSQRRFERIREKQVRELFDEACEVARTKLSPHERRLEHVYLGGDRRTLGAFRKRCDYFERFGERLAARVLPVAGDPRRASLDAAAREIYSSDVLVVGAERPSAK